MAYGDTYSDLYDPPFPASPIDARVELDLKGWTDVSTFVYQRGQISIKRGRADESSQVNPSSCSMTLDNRDGRFSINNPLGAWAGVLTRNTPLRASLPAYLLPSPANTPYLRMEDDAVSYASCPPASQLQITGSIDVRVDVEVSGYGDMLLAGRWLASASVNERCWYLALRADGRLMFTWSSDGTAGAVNFTLSAAATPLPIGRQAIRATLNAATGQVLFYTGTAGNIDSGTWTQLGATPPFPIGATSLHTSTTAPLVTGYSAGVVYDGLNNGISWISAQGAVYDLEVRNAIGGTVVAHPLFSQRAAGTSAWSDPQGNIWSLTGTAEISDRSYRFHGELSETPKAADPSATDVYSQATASGILRRRFQGTTPLRSPMFRAVTNPSSSTALAAPALAYWPCEDGANATQLASGLSGGSPMVVTGSPQLSSSNAFICSDALPVLQGSRWSGSLTAGQTAWTRNLLGLLLEIPATGETNGAVIARIYTTGTFARIDVTYATGSGGSLGFNCYNSAGNVVASGSGLQYSADSGTVGANGYPALIELSTYVQAGSLFCNLATALPNGSGVSSTNASVTGTAGAVSRVLINPDGTLTGSVVGHVFVANAADNSQAMTGPYGGALGAWLTEPAGVRIQRLCNEEGTQARIAGHPKLSAAMGAQTVQTFSSLLQECETTDRGMLTEPRTCLAVGYRTLTSLCNQAATATATYSAAAVDAALASTADDQYTFNDVTATNADGSSARQVLASGPLSIQAPPNGVGPVDTSIQVNAASDASLAHIAGWVLHVSTDYHDRFPTIPFNMARTQTPAAVPLLDIGDLLTIPSPPTWLQPDEIDQVAAGLGESFGSYGVWQIEVNAIPGYPYRVGIYDDPTFGRYDTDGSQTVGTVSTSATTFQVKTQNPGSVLWTTAGGDFPFDIVLSAGGGAGERMTVTNVTGSSSPQTFTVTRAVNGVSRSWPPGTDIRLFQPAVYGL